ncbi:MAG: adenine nucleotide alpha hydrolase family protein [Planctomycetota bacterium]
MKRIIYLSFGAGVQSTALLVMSNLGYHDCPRADIAIFADTGDEPQWVYENVERMRKWSGIPVETVAQGHLSADIISRHNGQSPRSAAIPAFTPDGNGRESMLRRQCTREYKIQPIERRVRELCGLKKGQRAKGVIKATTLIGISLDEATRMKPSRTSWVENRYPLVEAGLRRNDCLRLIMSAGLPLPQKSSCVFCPYHSDGFWRRLQSDYPQEWERVCDLDEAFRDMSRSGIARPVYLHRSLVPLRELDFSRQRRLFPDLEDEECEGGCFL